jgi:hypothetical protein
MPVLATTALPRQTSVAGGGPTVIAAVGAPSRLKNVVPPLAGTDGLKPAHDSPLK